MKRFYQPLTGENYGPKPICYTSMIYVFRDRTNGRRIILYVLIIIFVFNTNLKPLCLTYTQNMVIIYKQFLLQLKTAAERAPKIEKKTRHWLCPRTRGSDFYNTKNIRQTSTKIKKKKNYRRQTIRVFRKKTSCYFALEIYALKNNLQLNFRYCEKSPVGCYGRL